MTVYHISHKYLGKSPTLTPRIPDTRMEDEDGITPRVCVASSVENCYVAITGGIPRYPAMHVYMADGSATVPAKGVPDSRITRERWFLEPVRFTHVGKLPAFNCTMSCSQLQMRRNIRNTVFNLMRRAQWI